MAQETDLDNRSAGGQRNRATDSPHAGSPDAPRTDAADAPRAGSTDTRQGRLMRRIALLLLLLAVVSLAVAAALTYGNTRATYLSSELTRLVQVGEYAAQAFTNGSEDTLGDTAEIVDAWLAADIDPSADMNEAYERYVNAIDEYDKLYNARANGDTSISDEALDAKYDEVDQAGLNYFYLNYLSMLKRLCSHYVIDQLNVYEADADTRTLTSIYEVSAEKTQRGHVIGCSGSAYDPLWDAVSSGTSSTEIVTLPDDANYYAYVPLVMFDGSQWVFEVGISSSAFKTEVRAQVWRSLVVFGAVYLVFMAGLLALLRWTLLKPIAALTAEVERFGETKSPEVASSVRHSRWPADEVGMLADGTAQMVDEICEYVENIEHLSAERQRVAADLDIARRIQLGAVPHDFDSFTERYHLSIEGFMRPAREVGGDFYDVFDVGERGIAFVIGDVSGKGVPASLFMMRAMSLLRQFVAECDDVGTALTLTNRQLCERNDAMLFVTAFVGVLDVATGQLSFSNAGHNPPSVRRDGRREFLACKPGFVLGGIDSVSYQTDSLALSPGDRVVLYTDGVTEAMGAGEELYGDARLASALSRFDELRSRAGGGESGGAGGELLGGAGDEAGSTAGGAIGETADGKQTSEVGGELPSRPSSEPLFNVADDESHALSLVDYVVADIDTFAAAMPQADDITLLAFAWNLPVHRLELMPDDERLSEVFDFLRPLTNRDGCTDKMLHGLMIVCEELFVNICHYGYPEGQPRLPVVFEAAVDEGQGLLHLTISDQGRAYDPLAYEPQRVELGVEHRIGGLGLLLVRKNVDDIRYEHTDGRNILRMLKRFV